MHRRRPQHDAARANPRDRGLRVPCDVLDFLALVAAPPRPRGTPEVCVPCGKLLTDAVEAALCLDDHGITPGCAHASAEGTTPLRSPAFPQRLVMRGAGMACHVGVVNQSLHDSKELATRPQLAGW